jgi:hypothetical protein
VSFANTESAHAPQRKGFMKSTVNTQSQETQPAPFYDLLGAVFVAFILLVIGATGYYTWQETKTVAEENAGRIVNIRLDSGLLADRTIIETDQRITIVHGIIDVTKGDSLVIQRRASGSRFVCRTELAGPHTCKKLAV